MQKVQEYIHKFQNYIYSLDSHPSLQFLERQHKIKLSQKLIPVLKYLIPIIIIVFPCQLITILFGFLYPAYLTILTFQTPNQQNQNRILTYWIMFAFTQIISPIPQLLVHWFIWYLIRVLFLWLLLSGKYNFNQKLQKWVLLRLIRQMKSVPDKPQQLKKQQ